MSLERVVLDHLPSSRAVYVTLYRDVRNAAFLHSQLLAHNGDFEYALIDASVIFSRLQLLSAVFKAITHSVNGALKTPNVHSEIVMSLSPSNNIADAYRRFGISPSTKNLLVVKVVDGDTPSGDDIQAHLDAHFEGERFPVTDDNLAPLTDMSKLAKYYKLNGLGWLDGIKDPAAKHKETEVLVLGSMALRGL